MGSAVGGGAQANACGSVRGHVAFARAGVIRGPVRVDILSGVGLARLIAPRGREITDAFREGRAALQQDSRLATAGNSDVRAPICRLPA